MLGELVVTPSISGKISLPPTGHSTYAQYLAYGVCMEDDATTETNKPLEVTEYEDYSDYLIYDSDNAQFEVIQDFEAIIVPYVYCYRTAGGRPQMGLKINDQWIMRTIYAENELNAVGGIGWTLKEYASSGAGDLFTDVISELNGIRIKMSQGDTIALQKYRDTGWTRFCIKIYKLCEVNSDIDNFMNSINTLSDTSTYTKVELQ